MSKTSASSDGADTGTSNAEQITGIKGDPYLGGGSYGKDMTGVTGGEGDKEAYGRGSKGKAVTEAWATSRRPRLRQKSSASAEKSMPATRPPPA